MSTDDNEPPIKEVRRVRGRDVIPFGSECGECFEQGRTRVDTGPFGKYRRGKCLNDLCPFFILNGERHTWHVRIPRQCLRTKVSGQLTASLDETIAD
jgi:hypothetical protein